MARQTPVVVGGSGGDGLVEIESGLNVTDKLIANVPSDLKPGDSVLVEREDTTMGMN